MNNENKQKSPKKLLIDEQSIPNLQQKDASN
jgi:hypothetical protein